MVGGEPEFPIALSLQVKAKTEHPLQKESQRLRGEKKKITSPQNSRRAGGEGRRKDGGVEHASCVSFYSFHQTKGLCSQVEKPLTF